MAYLDPTSGGYGVWCPLGHGVLWLSLGLPRSLPMWKVWGRQPSDSRHGAGSPSMFYHGHLFIGTRTQSTWDVRRWWESNHRPDLHKEPKISEFIFLLPIRLVSPREVTSRIGSKNINSDIFGSLFVKIWSVVRFPPAANVQ